MTAPKSPSSRSLQPAGLPTRAYTRTYCLIFADREISTAVALTDDEAEEVIERIVHRDPIRLDPRRDVQEGCMCRDGAVFLTGGTICALVPFIDQDVANEE